MSPSFTFGRTVTLQSRAVTSTSADGNDVYGSTPTTVTGCVIWPRTSTENVQGGDLLITGLNLFLPPGTDVTAVDRVTLDDATVWDVDGLPGDYSQSPLTGDGSGVLVALVASSG